MLRKLSPVLLVCALGLAAGCGDDSDDESSKDATTTKKPAAAVSLKPFLLARGEEPGFQPAGTVDEITTVAGYVRLDEQPRDVALLRDRGFVAFVARRLEGTGPGITNLAVFKTAAGAKSETAERGRAIEADYRGWKVKRFDVSGVPGAVGWTATRPGNRVGNVIWVEGRCAMTLGNAEAKSFVGPLTKGVQAVHERVAGKCP